MTGAPNPAVEFITRDRCSLCDKGKADVDRWARRVGLDVREVDVDQDPALAEEYGARVPVVRTPAGVVLVEGTWPSYRLGAALVAYRLSSLRAGG